MQRRKGEMQRRLLGDEDPCECKELEEDMKEFYENLFRDCNVSGCPRTQQTNGAGSLSGQLGIQPNEAVLPDKAVNWRPT